MGQPILRRARGLLRVRVTEAQCVFLAPPLTGSSSVRLRSTSKTGKHGHAKAKITGLDIFTGKKYQELCPSTHNMNIPFVTRNEWTLNFIDEDGYAQVCSGPRSPFRDGARPVSPVFARILPRFRASPGIGGGAVVAMLSLAAAQGCTGGASGFIIFGCPFCVRASVTSERPCRIFV